MAVNIPATASQIPSERLALNDGGFTHEESFKDTYANLKGCLVNIRTGDVYRDVYVVKSASLSRTAADLGVLTICFAPTDLATDPTTHEEEQVALDETWTLKSVRNDKSLLAYCGPSAANPCRADVEAWLKEPDGSVAEMMAYTKADGTKHTITGQATIDLIGKYRAGHESVMRFYPMLTKTRIYSTPPKSVYENLASIDTPTISALAGSTTTGAKTQRLNAPGNLNTIISGHSWLKIQDDTDATADGKHRRIESWIGAVTGSENWDDNFYGTANRWAMPYQRNAAV